MSDLAGRIEDISNMVDRSYPADLDSEAHMWRRIMKVSEESGEVTAALLGFLGENPRKGTTHTLADVRDELLDVALAALGAVVHINYGDKDVVQLLEQHVNYVQKRLSAAVQP